MKQTFFFFFFFLLSLQGNCQQDWEHLFMKSESYYQKKQNVLVELNLTYKNALKADTNYFKQNFLLANNGTKVAKLTYRDSSGYSVFRDDSVSYIYTDSKTFYLGTGSDETLSFIPYWNPRKYFAKYTALARKHGVLVRQTKDTYILEFPQYDDLRMTLFINKTDYRITRSIEEAFHPKYGNQLEDYVFMEAVTSLNSDTLLNKLISTRNAFKQVTNPMLDDQEKKRQERRKELEGKYIEINELSKAIFGDDRLIDRKTYVLLDFFYQSCLPCIKSIGPLNEMNNKFDQSRLLIVGIDPIPEDVGHSQGFIDKFKIAYKVLDGHRAQQIKNIVLPNFAVIYPSTVLISPGGKIEKIEEGYSKKHFSNIEKIIGEK